MARNMYGATSADFTITSGGRVIPGAVLTLWTAREGGTQITDLLDVDSVACTTVTSAADGSVVYYGPDNDKTVHWADSGQGSRVAIRPTDITVDTLIDAKGDLLVGTGNDAVGRLPVGGTNGHALVVDSGQVAGVKWAAVGVTGVFDVTAYGAVGDDSTDDTTAIQSAIDAAGVGGTVVVPAGTYMVNAVLGNGVAGTPVGLQMTHANQTLILMAGATLKAIAIDGDDHSAVLQVSAADCTIEGPGTIMGTIGRHTNDTSEWHYGLDVNAGADRCTVREVTSTLCFGDGFFVMGEPDEVQLIDCRAINNRRCGLSLIDALRPKVTGGFYGGTGSVASTGPYSGIVVEPDPATSRDVIDFLISGVTFSGNKGCAVHTSANGRTLTGLVTGCRSTGDCVSTGDPWLAAFNAEGVGNRTQFIGCTAVNSGKDGFRTAENTTDILFQGCTSIGAAERSFFLDGTRPVASGCVATGGAYAGFYVASTAAGAYLMQCVSHSCASGSDDIVFHLYGDDSLLVGCVADAGTATPNYGFAVRTGATGNRLFGCSARGTFGSSAWLDQVGDAKAFPIPGVTWKPTVSGSRGSNAALESLCTALANLGLITNSTT